MLLFLRDLMHKLLKVLLLCDIARTSSRKEEHQSMLRPALITKIRTE